MKVRSHHGVRFVTGLALALSLAAQACVVDAGDEDEVEAARPVAQAVEPAAREEPAQAAEPAEEAHARRSRSLAGPARPRSDQRSARIHKLRDEVLYAEPPPNPW